MIPLIPGDVLLYRGSSPLAWAIMVKTASFVSHAELYVGRSGDIPGLAPRGWSDDTPVTVTARWTPLVTKAWARLRGRRVARPEGVDYYPFDPTALRVVLRPEQTWQASLALPKFEQEIQGDPYDTYGLFWSFYGRRFWRQDDKGFCSEVTRRVSEWGGVYAFPVGFPPDATAPAHFLSTPHYQPVWEAP